MIFLTSIFDLFYIPFFQTEKDTRSDSDDETLSSSSNSSVETAAVASTSVASAKKEE